MDRSGGLLFHKVYGSDRRNYSNVRLVIIPLTTNYNGRRSTNNLWAVCCEFITRLLLVALKTIHARICRKNNPFNYKIADQTIALKLIYRAVHHAILSTVYSERAEWLLYFWCLFALGLWLREFLRFLSTWFASAIHKGKHLKCPRRAVIIKKHLCWSMFIEIHWKVWQACKYSYGLEKIKLSGTV